MSKKKEPIDHREKSLMSSSSFAALKKVSRQAVNSAIVDKRIVPVYIGIDKKRFIDFDKYKDFEFSHGHNRMS